MDDDDVITVILSTTKTSLLFYTLSVDRLFIFVIVTVRNETVFFPLFPFFQFESDLGRISNERHHLDVRRTDTKIIPILFLSLSLSLVYLLLLLFSSNACPLPSAN